MTEKHACNSLQGLFDVFILHSTVTLMDSWIKFASQRHPDLQLIFWFPYASPSFMSRACIWWIFLYSFPDPLTFLENYKLFSKTSFKYDYHDRLQVFPGFFCFKLHVCMYMCVCMHACVMCTHTMCGCQRTISNCSSPSTLTEIYLLLVTIIYVKMTAQWSSKNSLGSVSKLPVGILG